MQEAYRQRNFNIFNRITAKNKNNKKENRKFNKKNVT